MMFYVAIPLVSANLRSGILEHDVAVAMEPYRNDPHDPECSGWWSSYSIANSNYKRGDRTPWAVIGTDGKWYCQCHVDEIDPRDGEQGYTIPLEDWKRELDEQFWDRLCLENYQAPVVLVQCKD